MKLVSVRYHLLYRILIMSPKSTMTITRDELLDAGLSDTPTAQHVITNDLNIRSPEYKIKAFKKHIRVNRI